MIDLLVTRKRAKKSVKCLGHGHNPHAPLIGPFDRHFPGLCSKCTHGDPLSSSEKPRGDVYWVYIGVDENEEW